MNTDETTSDGLTTKEQIIERLGDAIDTPYMTHIYNLMRKVFDPATSPAGGILDNTSSAFSAGGTGKFPNFPDLDVRYSEIGVSNRILNTQIITLSKVMSTTPEPHFPDVDKYTKEVRRQFWLTRSRPTGFGTRDWMDHLSRAFLDGDGLGTGFIQVGFEINPDTKKRKVSIKHVPILQVIYDRNARGFGDARWACVMHYMAVDQAKAKYGDVAEEYVVDMRDPTTSAPIRATRVFEYYDLGFGGGKPTMATILGDVTEEPYSVKENAFGCIPVAHYEHLLRPGMRRATGRIELLINQQEAINDLERRIRAESRRVGFDILPEADQFVTEDLEQIRAGKPGVIARLNAPIDDGKQPYVRIPGGEVSQTTLEYMQYLDKDFTGMSGITELDRGQAVQGADTLGEVELADQRSSTQGNWTVYQTAKFFQRVVGKVMEVAALGDEDPVSLDLFGRNVTFNDPTQSQSSITTWLKEPSRVIVGTESLFQTDTERDSAMKVQKLRALDPEVKAGLVDPVWRTKELVKALGYDPDEAMDTHAQPPENPTQPMSGQLAAQPQDPNALPQMTPPQQMPVRQ